MSTTSSPSLTDSAIDISTANILEKLSRQLMNLILAGQSDHPCISQYFSPEIEAYWHLHPPTTDLLGYRKVLECVDMRVAREVLNSCAMADEKEATVWVTTSASRLHAPHHMTVHHSVVCKLDWRRGEKGWIIVRQSTIRGPAFVGPC